jgi:hypothetical protein
VLTFIKDYFISIAIIALITSTTRVAWYENLTPKKKWYENHDAYL